MTAGGYGRYGDDQDHVGCPRAQSDMTPCVARDGDLATADDGVCVGCGRPPAELLVALVREITEPARVESEKDKSLAQQLAGVLNGHENTSNTPDFILADFLRDVLEAWDTAVQARAAWYGRMDVPGRGSVSTLDMGEDGPL